MEDQPEDELGEYYFEKSDDNLKNFLLPIIKLSFCKVSVFFENKTATEEERLLILDEMLDTINIPDEELLELVSMQDAINYFNMYKQKNGADDEYAITEKNYMLLTNSIINHIVYGMYNKLVDDGIAELAVDSDGNMIYRLKEGFDGE